MAPYYDYNDERSRYFCPEAIAHSELDADRDGKCRWCGRKVAAKLMRPGGRPPNGWGPAEIDIAYGMHWDPDWPYVDKRYET